ncbi:MAG: NADH-quinone oxidoreductase subunit C [Candidatus Marsarchaeota archaeon]|jgi:NADH-quinone oxidoreductase subunit C|nr:NADH-quinone oxidoreductase subunit C [Candidatus Marsarchaeota archaeon]
MEIKREELIKKLEDTKANGYTYLKKITAVDYINYLNIIYILYNIDTKNEIIFEVKLPSNDLKIDTVINVYKSADFYERELSEMFGIEIIGRKIKRLLLEEWDGAEAPLRKNFIWGNKDYKKL